MPYKAIIRFSCDGNIVVWVAFLKLMKKNDKLLAGYAVLTQVNLIAYLNKSIVTVFFADCQFAMITF